MPACKRQPVGRPMGFAKYAYFVHTNAYENDTYYR